MSVLIRFVLAALVVLGFWLTSGPALAAEWRDVTDDRLLNAGSDGANWLMYNRTYSGWRFSPLEQINTGNVKKLVPKWIFAGGTLGDQQTTPIVNDGIMFTTSTALGVNRVQAINAATGELLWKRDRRIPEDVGALVRLIPHNRGVALSKDKVIFGTLDANLLYFGTGNPAPWIADMRRGDNLYTMSAVALDLDSGKLKWYHQYLANEPWDFDTVSEHHVIDVVRDGQTHKAVVQANKLGYVYTLDRATGKFLSAVPFIKSLTWGKPDPVTGKGVENPGLRPTMGGPPVEVCPSLLGGTGWQPKVFNPKTGYMYIPANEFCMRYAYVADLSYKQGQLFTGVTVEHFSRAEQAGVLRAFDVNQNKVVWEWSNRTPLISHTLSTAGDLVFQGTAEGKVVAVNAKDGQELWSFSLGTPQSGGIITYAVDGKQYIAVAAGGTLRSQVWFGKEPKWAEAARVNYSDIVVVFGLSE